MTKLRDEYGGLRVSYRIVQGFLVLLEVALAGAVAGVVAVSLDGQWAEYNLVDETQAQTCLLCAPTNSAHTWLCSYAYWTAGASLVITIVIGLSLQYTAWYRGGCYKFMQSVLLLVGWLAWLVAGSILTHYALAAPATTPQQGYRVAVYVLCWVLMAAFLLQLLLRLFQRGGIGRRRDLDDIEAQHPSRHSHQEEDATQVVGWNGRVVNVGNQRSPKDPNARKRYYGLLRDEKDPSDYIFVETFTWQCVSALASIGIRLRQVVDLRYTKHGMPDALAQGELGSCTANAASNMMRYLLRRGGEPEFQPSRLFIYYNTRVRVAGKAPADDSGARLRDVCKAIKRYHACPEEAWPYERIQANYKRQPPQSAYDAARKHSLTYVRVPQTEYHVCACLEQGLPIMVGLNLYTSRSGHSAFDSDTSQDGYLPLPSRADMAHGDCSGHAVLLIGYDRPRRLFLILNSWGEDFGVDGCFFVPMAYVLSKDLAHDLWTFKFVK